MRTDVLLILFILSAGSGWSQSAEIRKDLSGYWQVSKDGRMEDYNGQAAHAIHLIVTDQFKGGMLLIKAPAEFTLFINGQLQLHARSECRLNVDSLLKVRSGSPLLSIYQKGDIKAIQTDLIYRGNSDHESFIREASHFKDFVILGSLLLFGFFVILFRSNTRLTIDYLNLAKVFSFQEREEAIVTGRIGSSVNILFFLFISLLCGLLMIIFFIAGPLALQFSSKASIQSATQIFVWWLLLSLFVLILLFGKLFLIWSMSALYGFKGVVRFQFFNFIRSLYVASVFMGVVLVGYFIIEIENPLFFYILLASACGFMILSALFLYFKLMTRTPASVFHLFSYLCGSEIIPLMILIKLLLN